MGEALMRYVATICAAAAMTLAAGNLHAEPLYPEVVVTSHATPEVAAFFKSYFTAKSQHKPAPTTDHFSEAHLTYIDAALGWPFYSKKGMTDLFEQYMPKWPPTGLSYPTRIIGDTRSALVAFTDTPELFGGEIRILAAIDFKEGKIVRWIDYWDGRSFGADAAAKFRTPPRNSARRRTNSRPTSTTTSPATAPRPRSRTWRKSSLRHLPPAMRKRPTRCSAMTPSISIARRACAFSASSPSENTCRVHLRTCPTAK